MISLHSRNSLVEDREETSQRARIVSGRRPNVSSPAAFGRTPQPRLIALGVVLAVQIVLLLIALVPQTFWASYHMPNGPIPPAMVPIVAGLFYVLPSLTGMLSRRWQAAVILATLPAWLDLGLFAVAAASRIGPYYLAVEPHAVSTVGTLELFAVLGALGWLARPFVLYALSKAQRIVSL